jgi:hypothetical protein
MENKNWKVIAITTAYRFLRVFVAASLTELGIILTNQEIISKLLNEFSFSLFGVTILVPLIIAGITALGKAIREMSESDLVNSILPF